jgi:hypothetical protein
MATPRRPTKRRKYRRSVIKSGSNPIRSLMKIMNDHNFKQQLSATADHLGMSERQVLTTVLGR